MKKEISVAGVIVNRGKIAIVFQNKTNTWALPKGHVDKGESELETAKREIHEETGINDLTFVKKLGSYERGTRKHPDIKKKITVLLFTTTQNNLQPTDPENPEAKWVKINEVANQLSYKEDKNFFLKIKDKI